MTINEIIKIFEDLKAQYGGDIEVCKLKRYDYLAAIFEDQIKYNKDKNKIEI